MAVLPAKGDRKLELTLQSDPSFSAADNLERLESIFHERYYQLDSARSRVPARTELRFRLRLVQNGMVRIVALKSSAFALCYHILRNSYHGFRKLISVRKGELFVRLEDRRTYALKAGEALIFDPCLPTLVSATGSVELTSVLFASNWLISRCGSLIAYASELHLKHEGAAASLFLDFLNLLSKQPEALSADTAEPHSEAICSLLVPVLQEAKTRNKAGFANPHDFLRACAIEAMYERLGDAGTTLKEIAKATGISPRLLSELFREVGTTAHDRLLDLRLEKASTELRLSGYAAQSIEEIARRNGFANPSHFGRVFKKRFGRTPLDWRHRI
jgi:AraC-like DNA-binding protein